MAFSFDGSTHLTTPTLNHGIGTGDFTFSAWCWTTTISTYQRPIWENSGSGFGIWATGTASPQLQIVVVGSGQTASGLTLTASAWQHVALVRSGTTLTAYLNGTAGGTTATSSASIANAAQEIGRSGWIGTPLVSGSRVAELAIWSAALSAGEIVGLSKRVAPPDVRTNGLRLYMPMRRERVDRWSFGGSATVTGTESYATHPPMVETLLGSTGDVAAGGGGGGGSGPVLQRLGLGLGVGV